MATAKSHLSLITSNDQELPSEDRAKPGGTLEDGIALCLSGGGYRAMLFHLGSLWYLNEHGLLRRLARVSSVSGGSIVSAALGMNWTHLTFDRAGVATTFAEQVVAPIRKLAATTIDRDAIIGGIFSSDSIGERLTAIYRKELLGNTTLQDLPNTPRFVINATNVQSGALFRFSKPYIWDYRVGKIEKPDVALAAAVAASSAFPPVLSPVTLKFASNQFVPNSGTDLQYPPFTREVVLTDGGVYDNLGIETAWKRYRTILVSDAGGKMEAEKHPKSDWVQHSVRILSVIDNQVRSLRKRQLIDAYKQGYRNGAYWGVRSNIDDYEVANSLPCPHEKTLKLAGVQTRLDALPASMQKKLINWGYAICDAAMRKHVDPRLTPPDAFPYPDVKVG